MTLFALGEPRTAEPNIRTGEIARGAYWSVVREGEEYLLCYLSADLLGREVKLLLREAEARSILAGQLPVEQFLLPRGAGPSQRRLTGSKVSGKS